MAATSGLRQGAGTRPLLLAPEQSGSDPREGMSWAHYNLCLPLRQVFPATTSYDFLARLRAVGKEAMNRELLELVESSRPDITIIVLVRDELLAETVRALSTLTTTVGYLVDDSWRRQHSNYWARQVDLVTTSERQGIERFRRAGIRNAVLSPMPFNEDAYLRTGAPKEYDLSFVGQYHPYREWLLERLSASGVRTIVRGPGWGSGTVSHDELVRIINASRINLNASNSIKLDPRYLFSSTKALKWTVKWTLQSLASGEGKWHEQVKGRHFEIAGCGGFQLSYDYAGLAEHFVFGREIETYRDHVELVRKVHYYLQHEDERELIAENGWRRAHADHTGRKRMRELVETALVRTDRR